MTGLELTVVAVGLLAGYWLVSFFLDGKRGRDPAQRNSSQSLWATPDRDEVKAAEQQGGEELTGSMGSAPEWYEVLGVSASASSDDIRAAYKKQLSQYHPDKVASLGPELRQLANQKSQEITQAYREGLAMRGLSA